MKGDCLSILSTFRSPCALVTTTTSVLFLIPDANAPFFRCGFPSGESCDVVNSDMNHKFVFLLFLPGYSEQKPITENQNRNQNRKMFHGKHREASKSQTYLQHEKITYQETSHALCFLSCKHQKILFFLLRVGHTKIDINSVYDVEWIDL